MALSRRREFSQAGASVEASRPAILLVDDDEAIRFGMDAYLRRQGYAVHAAGSLAGAQAVISGCAVDAIVLDYRLPDGDALPALALFREVAPVILLTAHGSIDLAVRAIKEGAEQFLTKPVELDALAIVIERVLDNQRARRQRSTHDLGDARVSWDPFTGSSRAVRAVAAQAAAAVASDGTVLLLGETGTGKGVLARWIHAQSRRRSEAFVDVNCAGLPSDLLESELFGHERGAFTGAAAAKAGLLEAAHRGTFMLDEIGDLTPSLQPKLLKAIEERRFRRLGELRERQVDFRLLAATHHDLELEVREQRFRADLYYRISALPLQLPPLRARREDVPGLAAAMLHRLGGEIGCGEVHLTPAAQERLSGYGWPGNLRELRNALERALLLRRPGMTELDEAAFSFLGKSEARPSAFATLAEAERMHIAAALEACGGQVVEAAKRLDIPRSTLYLKIRQYSLRAAAADGWRAKLGESA